MTQFYLHTSKATLNIYFVFVYMYIKARLKFKTHKLSNHICVIVHCVFYIQFFLILSYSFYINFI